ncbi:hypothetical protein V2W30_24540 [Streptomyces sp. Q6]|uniref:Uncharacterized protein n=1 Tax=Streptomyces citrinus TaxID=3118173 RepID=A0ACD5AG60_9ACTN
MRRPVITGVFVVALAAGGAAFRPVEPASEIRALAQPATSTRPVDDTSSPEAAEQARGEDLLRRAGVLLRDAYSVRMAADVRQGDKHVRSDIGVDHHGNCSGTIDDGDGVAARVVYLKGGADTDGDGAGDGEDEAYVKYGDAALAVLETRAEAKGAEAGARMRAFTGLARGKYVKAPSGPKGAQIIGRQCGVGRTLATTMIGGAAGTRALPDVRRDGELLTPLALPTRGGGGTAYVGAESDMRLHSMNGTTGGMRITITFSDYDKPFDVHTPDPAQVVEFPTDGGSVFEV